MILLQLVVDGSAGQVLLDGALVAEFENSHPGVAGWVGVALSAGTHQLLHVLDVSVQSK